MNEGLRLKNPTGLIKHLKAEEGKRLFPYRDTKGYTTIGYGRNLSTHGISETEAESLLINDIEECISDVTSVIPTFDTLPPAAQIVCIALRYNVGPKGFRSFKHFISYIQARDWKCAALELMDSKAARLLHARYKRMHDMLADIHS